MSTLDRDDSISPGTRSPGTSLPIDQLSAFRPPVLHAATSPPRTHPTIPNKDTQLPIVIVAENGSKAKSEPVLDYLNGGHPHEGHSPLNGSAPGSPRLPSSLRSSALGKNLEVGAPARDAVTTPGEPVSPTRRSVQFARADVILEPPLVPQARQDSWDDGEGGGRSRSERWMSRLKSTLGTAGPIQPPKSPSASENPGASTNSSPVATRSHRLPRSLSEEGSDADVEESGEENERPEAPKLKKRKRMKRRLKQLDVFNAPTTPRLGTEDGTESPLRGSRLNTMVRRSTMPDASEHRGGLSEGEGRDQLTGRRPAWRRGNSWVAAPMVGPSNEEEGDGPQSRTPAHRRRISEMFSAGGVSDGDGLATPRRPWMASERAATFGAQRWRQVKHTFKMFSKKKSDQVDFFKSAELMAELRAVTPAVVILASMLQRDEHGNRRIPVLLEQLNIRVIDSFADNSTKDSTKDRHSEFVIELEYGSGLSRMRWTVTRGARDLWNVHWKYKLSREKMNMLQSTNSQRGRFKQPHFPRKLFPYLRAIGGNSEESDEDERPHDPRAEDAIAEATGGEGTAAEGTASDIERRPNAQRKRTRMKSFLPRRQSSGFGEALEGSLMNTAANRRKNIERSRKAIEKYLQDMVHWLMFRPDSHRLCKFLELSALGVRLAAEGSFHGKECYLHIQSTKGIDFRRVLTPQKVVERHGRKWFLVRQNYIAVVESPATMNIYDVYLVDPYFRIVSKKSKLKRLNSKTDAETEKGKQKEPNSFVDDETPQKHHTLKIYTAERKIKLFSSNQTVLRQFEESVTDMMRQTKWHEEHRFGSFAPVRYNAFAQWLVDGRDYMWNLSRAISMAQDVIYIHDWWLTPELYMRRPACISQKWRLDRLLQRKAREGVKVFVIVYRNVEQAIPIDSEYTKFSLLNLHDNIMVLRSPNQLKKNQFFYAHHEKVCIVDHDVAFLGGIDLCLGRWDNPQHPVVDDRPTGLEPEGDSPRDAEHCQLFPGKDYSNPRELDFFKLHEPYEEMYDRSKIPRMPWHDIGMQVVGQPARDLTRHFVQRWNYLRRERKPTRPTPFLLPPPDANQADLEALGLTGTCEVQMLRSAGDWSLGYPKDLREHSIQSAYIKLIEESEHFVYMENQFFITSTETLNTKVVNRIGDALVERIIRAHENDEDWRCCVLIPLVPGFQNTVDQAEGSSVRLIMQFQYRSICRGPHSIFGRLLEVGIEPEDYISFFSLRNWGHFNTTQYLTTEQLYIHAKTIIVDDRVALIGSANINERSMLGNRDSETAAVVRDTDTMLMSMGGRPYRVGRFAHTLRVRLMREHLGLDVDEITEDERQAELNADFEAEMDRIYDEGYDGPHAESSAHARPRSQLGRPPVHTGRSFNHDAAATQDQDRSSSASSVKSSTNTNSSHVGSPERDDRVDDLHDRDVEGYGADQWKAAQEKGVDVGSDTLLVNGHEVLIHPRISLGKGEASGKLANGPHSEGHFGKISTGESSGKGNDQLPPPTISGPEPLPRTAQIPNLPVLDDTDIGGPPLHFNYSGEPTNESQNPLLADIFPARIDKDCMRDPLDPTFWDDVWARVAANNTKLYRRVFRCMPDSEVLTWKDYVEFNDYGRRFKESMSGSKGDESAAKPNIGAAAAGVAAPAAAQAAPTMTEKLHDAKTQNNHPTVEKEQEELNEKAPITESGNRRDPEKIPELRISSPEQDHTKSSIESPPSPLQPVGDVPFPAYDGQASGNALLTRTQSQSEKNRDRRATFSSVDKSIPESNGTTTSHPQQHHGNTTTRGRRRRATTRGSRRGPIFPYDLLSRDEAEELCGMIQGHLVEFPYNWLEAEEKDNHWLYQADLLAPKEIYD